METRSKKRKRRRLISISSHVSSWPDLPARFESLNDDTLGLILKFVGNRSYGSFGGLNYHCKEIYIASGMTKETFIFGYAPLSVIQERYERDWKLREALCIGIVYFNRGDVLIWALEEQNNDLFKAICNLAGREGRLDLLDEVLSNVDKNKKEFVFLSVDKYAAGHGKLNVLKWLEEKEIVIDNGDCVLQAARGGHLHILKWLREEKGSKLDGKLYGCAIDGGQLHVMKWLREQACPWSEFTFFRAALRGSLVILQWLHDEGCPWPEDPWFNVSERSVKPEVKEWLLANGYRNKIEDD